MISSYCFFIFPLQEVDRFKEAMKKEEFRKLLCGYAQEISNPENKKVNKIVD